MIKYEHKIGSTVGTGVEKEVQNNFNEETQEVFCEMNGIIKDDLKANIEMMLEGEKMANAEKREASEKAAAENLEDATDFFKESSKDEGRHYKILEGILERYF